MSKARKSCGGKREKSKGSKPVAKEQVGEEKVTFNISKEENFSEWFTEIVKRAELADLRYNVKGFIVFQPWSVLAMEKMYRFLEETLQRKGHKPYWFPTLIPESNFKLEAEHVKGFTPEVFWVTEHGDGEKLSERLALRPTSETAFYKMFSYWIRSYRDLPLKTYQRANVFRYETKATRPFLRSREFYWIEAHCAFASEREAMEQVREDMETTKEVLHDIFGLPFIFFRRPEWDKFAGAVATFAADVLHPDGKVVQQPSTHLLGQNFSKPFNIKFRDRDGREKYVYITCYGPAVSRIFASVIAIHGDDYGLRFPWRIAPLQVIIVPVASEKNEGVIKKALELKEFLLANGIDADVDLSERSVGDKFYYWEMKGVPLRIEIGPRELEQQRLVVFRRDTMSKEEIAEIELLSYIERVSKEIDKNLIEQADKAFENRIVDAKSKNEIAEALDQGKIARCNFCSVSHEGEKCAEVIEKELKARVRGTRLEPEKPDGPCVICGKKASAVVYIAREY